MSWEWRAITHDDVPAWNALLAAAEEADVTGEHYNESDLHEELDEIDTDLSSEDRVGAWEGGRMVAYAAIRPRGGTEYWRVHGEGTVEPGFRGRGLGAEGVAWIAERVRRRRSQLEEPQEARIEVSAYVDNAQQVSLLED